MTNIKENLKEVTAKLPEGVRLVAVSKFHPVEELAQAYEAGQRLFGENRAQELIAKAPLLPKDIRWHFIGHLQKNKVRSILPVVSCIQSLDSIALAEIIEKEAARINKTVDVLAEFHLASEDENKTGLNPDEAFAFFDEVMKLEHLNLCGIMAMGPHTDDEQRVRDVFLQGKKLFDALQERYGKDRITTLSMGMSSDYKTALSCGSTMVRIGTYLFE